MHITMISDVYFPRINGVSTSIETFRAELPACGVEASLIAPAYPLQEAADQHGIFRVPSSYVPLDPEDRLMNRRAVRELLPRLRDSATRLIHVQTPFVAHYLGLELAHALGVPCIASYHTFFEEYLFHYVRFLPRSWMRSFARRFSRQQCNALDHVIVPSRAMARALLDYGVTRPVSILPTGLPSHRFHGGDGSAFRERYDLPRERKLMLYVGRVAHEKNIGFLLDATARLRATGSDAILLVTGEGPALPGLRARAEQLGLGDQVRFLGYLDRHQELHDCYRAADLFVFASRTETQGLVLLEAMALGTPVLALAEMGTRDILEAERGCRIAPTTPEGFADAARTLLEDRTTLRRLEGEAQEFAREWSAENLAQRLAGLYRSCLQDCAEDARLHAEAETGRLPTT